MNKKVLTIILVALGLGTIGFFVSQHYGAGCGSCKTSVVEESKVEESVEVSKPKQQEEKSNISQEVKTSKTVKKCEKKKQPSQQPQKR